MDKKEIILTIVKEGYDHMVLQNSRGDTYTTRSEHLIDFIGWAVEGQPAINIIDSRRVAMNIVNQLFDVAEVSSERRQAINDQCDDFTENLLTQFANTTNQHLLQENERLRKLAELHEAYLKECPCDYDITSESLQAWNNLQTFKKENNL